MVIAKTLDGDLGILTGHPPVLGIAAVSSGFLAVRDDRVSILARQAQLGTQVDTAAAQTQLEAALAAAEGQSPGEPEPAEVKYNRALLRAAGDQS